MFRSRLSFLASRPLSALQLTGSYYYFSSRVVKAALTVVEHAIAGGSRTRMLPT